MVDAVSCEPVSAYFPVIQGKYREFSCVLRQCRCIELQKPRYFADFRPNSLDTGSGKYLSISGKVSRATVNYKVAVVGSKREGNSA